MNKLYIEINTDDDFSIDGKGFYDGGYKTSFPLKEGESHDEAYERWLESITIIDYKNRTEDAEYIKDWLKNYNYMEYDETLYITGGNWDMVAWVAYDEPKAEETTPIVDYVKSLPQTTIEILKTSAKTERDFFERYIKISEKSDRQHEIDGLPYYRSMFEAYTQQLKLIELIEIERNMNKEDLL